MTEQKTKICKYCATEIPYQAKICPNCHKKVKGGKIKWIIIGIIIFFFIVAIFGSGDEETTTKQTSSKNPQSIEATTEEVKIEYHTYKCTDLLDDLKNNALKAEKAHQDEYVIIKGYLDDIDSDGAYFHIAPPKDDYDHLFENIYCSIENDEQLNKILELNEGDKITIKGQINDIGEFIGYRVKVIEIQ